MTQLSGPRALRPGEAVPIRDLAVGGLAPRVVHIGLTALDPAPDHVAFLVGAEGKVRTDDDFVFHNQPDSGDGAVTHSGRHAPPSGYESISPSSTPTSSAWCSDLPAAVSTP